LRFMGISPASMAAIVLKDLREFSRDRLWMILSPLSLLFILALFQILPEEGVGTVRIGIHPGFLAAVFNGISADSASFQLQGFPSEDSLRRSFENGTHDLAVGISLSDGFPGVLLRDTTVTARIFMSGSLPPLMHKAMEGGIGELGFAAREMVRGRDPLQSLPVTFPDQDSLLAHLTRPGASSSMKQGMKPLIFTIILLIESLALAGLVSTEIKSRTAEAILVTPATTADLLAAKCFTGVLLALGQAVLMVFFTGGFGPHWISVLLLLFLGAAMSSAAGMIAGAGGRDFMGTLFFGMLLIIPLMIPAVSSLIPGRPALLIRLLPSYGLVQGLNVVMVEGAQQAAMSSIISLVLWITALMVTAIILLRRRVESL